MRRALCPAEAVPAAHPLSQEPSTGTDHHPQLWSGAGLEPDKRGSSPPACFQNRAAAQKAHRRRLTPCLNVPVENPRGGGGVNFKPSRCVLSQIFSCLCSRRGVLFTWGRCHTFLTWILNHLSVINWFCVRISNNSLWILDSGACQSARYVYLCQKNKEIYI